ncbi:hypothetical protein AC579_10206 [Pseudocercospora musae]|uniref:Uncharacterized protein n=1 Tax=Pseudocercospora musae TaxID=113226 RepID=A0A139GV45_9PEZI|nr:hypothetical protein AC579_10206 [Pseudocercospora musae]
MSITSTDANRRLLEVSHLQAVLYEAAMAPHQARQPGSRQQPSSGSSSIRCTPTPLGCLEPNTLLELAPLLPSMTSKVVCSMDGTSGTVSCYASRLSDSLLESTASSVAAGLCSHTKTQLRNPWGKPTELCRTDEKLDHIVLPRFFPRAMAGSNNV